MKFNIEKAFVNSVTDGGFCEFIYPISERSCMFGNSVTLKLGDATKVFTIGEYVNLYVKLDDLILKGDPMYEFHDVKVIYSSTHLSDRTHYYPGSVIPKLYIAKINSKTSTEGNPHMSEELTFTKSAKQKTDDFIGTPAYIEAVKEIKRKFIEDYDMRLKSLEFLVTHFVFEEAKDTVESSLNDAKMIYDYLAGESKHFK